MHARIFEQIRAACAERGLDLAQPLCARWYNDIAAPAHRLADLGRSAALVVVVGNTRALWPHLAGALAADAALARDADPVDRYCTRVVHAAMAEVGVPWLVRFAHEPPHIPMQRLAHVAGLAHLSPSHLSIHPLYGPWIALRAAIVIDVDGPPGPPPALAPPCDCAAHCMPCLAAALAQGANPERAQVERDWRAWLAVRDACPVGRAHRYDDDQLRYHYTKDRRFLPDPGRG